MLIKAYFNFSYDDLNDKYDEYVRALLDIGAESSNFDVDVKCIKRIEETPSDECCPKCKNNDPRLLKKWLEGEITLCVYSCEHCDNIWLVENL